MLLMRLCSFCCWILFCLNVLWSMDWCFCFKILDLLCIGVVLLKIMDGMFMMICFFWGWDIVLLYIENFFFFVGGVMLWFWNFWLFNVRLFENLLLFCFIGYFCGDMFFFFLGWDNLVLFFNRVKCFFLLCWKLMGFCFSLFFGKLNEFLLFEVFVGVFVGR